VARVSCSGSGDDSRSSRSRVTMTSRLGSTSSVANAASVIIVAVGEIVDEVGPADVSRREAARRAGVSHAAPAYHFGDKEGLLSAYCHQGFGLLHREVQSAYDAALDGPARERMVTVGVAYARFAMQDRSHFEVMFRSGIDKSIHHEIGEESGHVFGLVLRVIGELMDEGNYPEEDPVRLAVYFWSVAHGFASIAVDGSMPPGFEDFDILSYASGVFDLAAREA
jgi:AcrR family transcriptional regulator